VFLDKDGTLVEDVPYNVDPELIRLAPGAAKGLQQLAQAGYPLVVISNQSGVARGLFDEADLLPVQRRLRELLADLDVPLAGFYYCPHHPRGRVKRYSRPCHCRKPSPGLILQAARELRLNLSRSWFVGDILDDIEAGKRAGCQAVLIGSGETEWQAGPYREPDFTAPDLAAAAQLILTATLYVPWHETLL
jgi:histidinol-phosphate phosphatase family protein